LGATELVPKKFNTKFKSVIIFGTATEVHEEEKKEGLMILVRRLAGDHMKSGEKYIKNDIGKTRVYKIIIEHISGKGSKGD